MNRMMSLPVTLLLLLSACAAFQPEYEFLTWRIEPGWKVGYHAEVPGQQVLTEWIREGDDIKNWKELMTFHNFPPPWGGPSPEDALNGLKTVREKNCPGVTKWNVIARDETSILYEWQAKPCLGWPDQHEIVRVVYGKYNRFVLRYTVKAYQMPPEQRDKWVKIIATAHIKTTTTPPPSK